MIYGVPKRVKSLAVFITELFDTPVSTQIPREFVTTLMINTKVNGSGTLTRRVERVFRIRFIEALKTVAAGRIIGIGGAIRSFFEGTADL